MSDLSAAAVLLPVRGLKARATALGLSLLYYVLAFACLIAASSLLRGATGMTLAAQLRNGVGFAFAGHAALLLALAVLPTGILLLSTRATFAMSGWALTAWARQLCLGLLLGAAAMALISGVLIAIGALHVEITALSSVTAIQTLLLWALLWVVQSMHEEAFARGYGFIQLSRSLGFWPAALVSSAAFAAGHLTNAGETPLGLVNAALLGLGFAYSLRSTGSLWLALGFHAAWNFMQSTVFGFANSGEAAADSLAQSVLTGPHVLTGGSAGPEGSALTTCAAVTLIAVLWVTHSNRRAQHMSASQ